MARTREALLAATLTALADNGVRRLTMTEVAAAAGIAKATMYNHFRTKPDLLRATARAQAEAVVAEAAVVAAAAGAGEGLARAARAIGEHRVVRELALNEPAAIAELAAGALAVSGAGAQVVRDGVIGVLRAGGLEPNDALTAALARWLVSFLLAYDPNAPVEREAAAILSSAVDAPTSSAVTVAGVADSSDTNT